MNEQQLHLMIDKELHTEFKSLAARKNITMAKLISRFIKEWLEKNSKGENSNA